MTLLLSIIICILHTQEAYSDDRHGVSDDVNTLRFLHFPTDDHPVEMKYGDVASTSNLVPNAPTIILIDGFLSTYPSNMSATLMESLVQIGGDKERRNIIVLDWGTMSGGHSPLLHGNMTFALLTLIPIVTPNLPRVGQRVAEFLHFLRLNKQIYHSDVHLIGHSTGANIAGSAGRFTHYDTPINRITGLDPANDILISLSRADAVVVDVYHTNRGGMGTRRTDVGDIEVYINGGNNQPKCDTADLILGYCDHTFSRKFFDATIYNSKLGCPCSTKRPSSAPTCFCNILCNNSCGLESTSLGCQINIAKEGDYHISVNDLNRNSEKDPAVIITKYFFIIVAMCSVFTSDVSITLSI